MKHQLLLAMLLIGAVAAYTGFYLKHTMTSQAAFAESTGQCRPNYELRDLSGEKVSGETWDGKVVLLNFWAAWCPPCRREIPAFSEVREFYHEDGFEVIGIAIDDLDSVRQFLADTGSVRYPQLIGEEDATLLMRELGNKSGGLPFSVLLDRSGAVRFTKSGELKKTALIDKLRQLLDEPAATPCLPRTGEWRKSVEPNPFG